MLVAARLTSYAPLNLSSDRRFSNASAVVSDYCMPITDEL